MNSRPYSTFNPLLIACLMATLALSAQPLPSARAIVPSQFAASATRGAGTAPFSAGWRDVGPGGKPPLVAMYHGGEDVSGPLQTAMACTYGRFQTAVNYSTGRHSRSVAVGDFNRDGKLDLAVANMGELGTGYSVSVLLGNGNGTFQAAVNYGVGYGPTSVAVGDFNGDARRDLAVTNWGNSNNVSVLLGNGNGTFQAAANFSAGNGPYSVAVGDFNRDGKADLAVANFRYSDVDGTVSVLLGNGNGTFQAAVNYAAGPQPDSVAVADFNGDNKPDLAVGDFSFFRVSLLPGNGDGTFQTGANYSAGSPSSIAVGEFNDDGKLDLAVAGGGSVGVLLGNGDGTFPTARFYGAGSSPSSVAVGDFNGDGKPDLAVANSGSDNVSILLNACCLTIYLPVIPE